MTARPTSRLFGPLAALAALALPGACEDETPSLQGLLERLRQERDAELTHLEPRVEDTIRLLEELGARAPLARYETVAGKLRSLGPVAVPLLVAYLEPGEDPKPEQLFRADEVTLVLQELPTLCVLGPLLAMAMEGTEPARVNALLVLGGLDVPGRVRPFLESVFESAEGEIKYAALRSLARLGGPRATEVLRVTLGAGEGELLAHALDALASGRITEAAAQVLDLARDTERAAEVPLQLAAYYEACPEMFDADVAGTLLQLVLSQRPSGEECVALLGTLRDLEMPNTTDMRSTLREIVGLSAGPDVAEEARISLALMNDTRAKRQVLEPYDLRVKKNPEWVQALRDRGMIHMRLRDYRAAQRDFRSAIDLQHDKRKPTSELQVLLARCHALDGRLRNAADELREAELTAEELSALRLDPDFAELADSRQGRVFDGQ